MHVIGIDTNKATLAACAIDDLGQVIDDRTVPNSPDGFDELAGWLAAIGPVERIGVEGSAGYGAGVARFLLAAGRTALEVPPQLSHRERTRTRRAGKSDPGDALAIARVTRREPDLPPVRLPDAARELGLLVEAREDLVAEATRIRNRLHADLVVLVPGYGASAANLVAASHRRMRRLPGVDAELARERLARLGRVSLEARALERRIDGLVADHPLRTLPGAGALVTAKLVSQAGDMTRFRSADAFAMLAGVAPIPASSGRVPRMRLNRGGNRQLNRALYSIAFAQVRDLPARAGLRGAKAGRGQELARGHPGAQAPPRPSRLPAPLAGSGSGIAGGGLTR